MVLDCKLSDDIVGSEPTHFLGKEASSLRSPWLLFMSEMTCDLKGG